MNWYTVTIEADEDLQEILIAELLEMGFSGFEQEASSLRATLSSTDWRAETGTGLDRLTSAHGIAGWLRQTIPETNWNRIWEQSIRPIRTGPFLIRPSWIDENPGDSEILLIIDPKMSFGTGVHPTTRLILALLPNVVSPRTTHVLDAGTGTGILAIAAAKLGAVRVTAFDTDPWSERNAAENILANGVEDCVSVFCGEIDRTETGIHDLVLANINRNSLLEMAERILARRAPNGSLILSGLLVTDRQAILDRYLDSPLVLLDERQDGEWIALHFGES